MTAAVRDDQQSAVYSAEHMFMKLVDRGGPVQIAGTTVTVPADVKFGDIDSVQRFVDAVLSRPTVRSKFGTPPPVHVRARRGHRAAHYEPWTHTIAVPTSREGAWALRSTACAHEVAHHLDTSGGASHGPAFVNTMLTLVEDVMGPEAAFVLRVLYHENGVHIG